MRAYGAANRERLNEYARQYRKDNAEKIRAAKKAKQPEDTARSRRYYWARKYGLTVDEAETMLESQGGVCAICKQVEPNGKHLAVDHCHETGVVRGFLCTNCNNGLGRFKDNPELLIRAADYISANIRGQT